MLLLIWLSLTFACVQAREIAKATIPVPTSLVTATIDTGAGPTSQVSESALISITPETPEPTGTSTVNLNQDSSGIVLEPPSGLENADREIEILERWLLIAWENDTEFSDLAADLTLSGWTSKNKLQLIDVDRDRVQEWLIEYTHPAIECFHDWVGLPCGGDILIIGDGGIEYQFSADADPNLDYQWGPIVTVTRFTDTTDFFIVIQTGGCGAHTCWDDFTILKSEDGKLVPAIEFPQEPSQWGSQILYWHPADSGQPIHMTYAEHAIIDMNGDGRDELVLEGGWVGSGGSGIQRERTEIWGWTGSRVGLIDLIWHPSELSLHLLREAGDLVEMGRYDEAAELYTELVGRINSEDENDLGQADPYHVAFFSAFRLVHLGYLQEDEAMLQEWVAWMEQTDPTHPVAVVAARLIENWNSGATLEAACSSVLSELQHVQGIEAFIPEELGYANPPIELADICPLS